MESFYNEIFESYNDVGRALDDEATKIVEPLFKKYIDIGYSAREISQVICNAVTMVEASTIMEKTAKILAKQKKLNKNN